MGMVLTNIISVFKKIVIQNIIVKTAVLSVSAVTACFVYALNMIVCIECNSTKEAILTPQILRNPVAQSNGTANYQKF
jgi:hypothetical protein